jgi:hypothetical protein
MIYRFKTILMNIESKKTIVTLSILGIKVVQVVGLIVACIMLFTSCKILPSDNYFVVTQVRSYGSGANNCVYYTQAVNGEQTAFIRDKPGVFNVGDTIMFCKK